MDWVKTVNKLKGKLHEATGHGYQVIVDLYSTAGTSIRIVTHTSPLQEGAVKKILHRLGTVPMTLELLQVTI